MKRLVARLARALTRRRQPVEDVCWCGIHHLGAGYIHEKPLPPVHVPAPHVSPNFVPPEPAAPAHVTLED